MTILFVCTGNTCRSPMAEGLFNAAAQKAGLDARALSCGLSVSAGHPATSEAVEAISMHGVDISGHAAVQISEVLVAGASDILGMTLDHVAYLRQLYPDHAGRIDILDNDNITDPFCQGQEVYRAVARQIAGAVERLVERLSARGPS